MRLRRLFAGLALCGLSFGALAADEHESFNLGVPLAPMAVTVEGHLQVFYELHLSNFSRQSLVPVRIEAVADDGERWADYSGDALASRLAPRGPWHGRAACGPSFRGDAAVGPG